MQVAIGPFVPAAGRDQLGIVVGDPQAAVEMALIRLCYAADLPGPEEALKALRDGTPVGAGPGGGVSTSGGSGAGGGATAQARVMGSPAAQSAQAAPVLASFSPR